MFYFAFGSRSPINSGLLRRWLTSDPRSVLTWISIYWFSRAGPASSIRIYYEMAKSGEILLFPKTSIPVGVSFFPKDPVRAPRAYVLVFLNTRDAQDAGDLCSLLHSKARIAFESEHEAGGHFAAYEQPEALVSDLRKMFGRTGPAAGVVPGHTGY